MNKQQLAAIRLFNQYKALMNLHVLNTARENKRYANNIVKRVTGINDRRVIAYLASLYKGVKVVGLPRQREALNDLLKEIDAFKQNCNTTTNVKEGGSDAISETKETNEPISCQDQSFKKTTVQ